MNEPLVWIPLVLMMINILLLVLVLMRMGGSSRATESAVREELRAGRSEASTAGRELRAEVGAGLKDTADSVVTTIGEMGRLQQQKLDTVTRELKDLTTSNERRIEGLRATIETQLASLQDRNEAKLEEMRKTVDEKLHGMLENRLGESFRAVSERLERVHQGLGEMKSLASGVGDLKRVLTNVKTRGVWGEIQLGAILEQMLTPDQYARNVRTKDGSLEHVEFAIKLPGAGHQGDSHVLLPIDSKFPQEDYLRLCDAADCGDVEAVQGATKALIRAVTLSARVIMEKYLNPPATTDFAIMFLPTEGLYAEVLRQPGLLDELQRDYRVVIAGPTTLAAILSSLRLGFRTLAIERRVSEVWQLLAAVKTEFSQFGDTLAKVRKKLESASEAIDKTSVRTRAMDRRLKDVEAMPIGEATSLLNLEPPAEIAEAGEESANDTVSPEDSDASTESANTDSL